jgi:hypothetical protein
MSGAIEAPLSITQTSYLLCTLLSTLSLHFECFKRFILVIGARCAFLAIGFVYINASSLEQYLSYRAFNEMALKNKIGQILWFISIIEPFAFALRKIQQSRQDTIRQWSLVENQRNKRVIKIKFLLYLLIIVLYGTVLAEVAFVCTRESGSPHFQVLVDCILPPSINHIQEWDQSVSLSAGATSLGFSIYCAGRAQYRQWCCEGENRRKTD